MSERKQLAPEFKAKVALEALKGEGWRTVAPVARHKPEQRRRAGDPVRGASDMIHQWKRALLEGAAGVFERGDRTRPRGVTLRVRGVRRILDGATPIQGKVNANRVLP